MLLFLFLFPFVTKFGLMLMWQMFPLGWIYIRGWAPKLEIHNIPEWTLFLSLNRSKLEGSTLKLQSAYSRVQNWLQKCKKKMKNWCHISTTFFFFHTLELAFGVNSSCPKGLHRLIQLLDFGVCMVLNFLRKPTLKNKLFFLLCHIDTQVPELSVPGHTHYPADSPRTPTQPAATPKAWSLAPKAQRQGPETAAPCPQPARTQQNPAGQAATGLWIAAGSLGFITRR